jgi:protein-L-isoaspartate(D-aspartate) O-methyltransferase
VEQGRLESGLARHAPYDVIFLNGACECRPVALLEQLTEGGRLVCILSEEGRGRGHLFVKSDGAISDHSVFDAIVPVLPGFARAPGFAF